MYWIKVYRVQKMGVGALLSCIGYMMTDGKPGMDAQAYQIFGQETDGPKDIAAGLHYVKPV